MRTPTLFAAFAATALLGLALFGLFGPVQATHRPADKLAVSSSTVEVMNDDGTTTVTLLSGTMRTSSPTDLIFRATLECALWTDLVTVGNDEAQAIATVKVWVEFDGVPVGVTGDDADGKVVFCNRDYKRVTSLWDDQNATIEDYLHTRTANAFNWIRLNSGRGIHSLVLKASLETETLGDANAVAAVGKRTFIVEPVKLANDVSI